MLKLQKILSILFIILLFFTTLSFATDINMNLEDESILENEESFNDVTSDTAQNTTTTNIPSTIVSNSNSANDDSLGLTNILNILLIVVGVVLILLGIAILIRMHS